MGSGQFPIINCNGLTPLPSISPGRRSPYPLKGNLSRREHLQTTNSYCRYPVVFWSSSLVTGKATSKMRCGAYVGRSKTRRNPTKTGHPLQYQNLPRRLDHVLPLWIRRLGTERGVVTPCTTHLSFKTRASHYPKSSFLLLFFTHYHHITLSKPYGEVGGMYVAGMDLLAAISLSPHVGGASVMAVAQLNEVTVDSASCLMRRSSSL